MLVRLKEVDHDKYMRRCWIRSVICNRASHGCMRPTPSRPVVSGADLVFIVLDVSPAERTVWVLMWWPTSGEKKHDAVWLTLRVDRNEFTSNKPGFILSCTPSIIQKRWQRWRKPSEKSRKNDVGMSERNPLAELGLVCTVNLTVLCTATKGNAHIVELGDPSYGGARGPHQASLEKQQDEGQLI